MARSRSITTVHLGQYTRGTANAIAGELEKAGIVWRYKERLFVDKTRLDEANAIAERVSSDRERRRIARQERGEGSVDDASDSDS